MTVNDDIMGKQGSFDFEEMSVVKKFANALENFRTLPQQLNIREGEKVVIHRRRHISLTLDPTAKNR